jgi:glycine betaine/proline transport system permease protein
MTTLILAQEQEVESGVPRIPVGETIERGFDWVQTNLGSFFDAVSDAISSAVSGLTDLLQAPHALIMVVAFAAVAWLVRDWKLALGSALSLLFVLGMDQWDNAMQTLSMVVVATAAALVIGIPLGIAAARWEHVSRAVRPVMDLMQTMPAFVWLVPVVTLFSIGVPAGLVATVIFALPPGVRLTELGIRQVDPEVVEAGHAFGSSNGQILRGIQLPLAMPTVMAGVNQVIMLALSMAVIAGLVGGGGLGSAVTTSISRLDVGLGFEAGLSVVVLAIYLDRVTAAIGSGGARRLRWRRGRPGGRSDTDTGPLESEVEEAKGPHRQPIGLS